MFPVYLSGVRVDEVAAFMGPVRVHLQIDGARLVTTVKTTLKAREAWGPKIRCSSKTISDLVAGKLQQPWSAREGEDGLEVLLDYQVSQGGKRLPGSKVGMP